MPQLKEMSEEQIEKMARAEGWVPEDEFQGEPPRGGFKSAYQFLETSDQILPIVRGQLKKTKKELAEIKSEMEQVKKDSVSANAILQRQIQKEQEEKERILREAEQARANAITEGDGEAAVMAERRIHEIRQQPVGYDTPEMRATVDAWNADNSWFNENRDMRMWAEAYSRSLLQEGMAAGVPVLAAVAEKARSVFPDYFASKEGRLGEPGDLTTSGRKSNLTNGRGFDDLPQEAQDAYYRQKKLIPGFTQKQYLEQYDWDE